MCGMLSSSSREAAMTLRSSTPLALVMRAGLGDAPESGVLGVEDQRHERLEAARLILESAKLKEVVDPFFVRLHVAVEYCAVAFYAKAVCDSVDLNPALPGALIPANYLAHTGARLPRALRDPLSR
jgi:hypothetical protein